MRDRGVRGAGGNRQWRRHSAGGRNDLGRADQLHHFGGTDRGREEEGNWRWASGESWDFTSFAFGQPDGSGDCLQLWYTFGSAWDDLDCELARNYLCERDGS